MNNNQIIMQNFEKLEFEKNEIKKKVYALNESLINILENVNNNIGINSKNNMEKQSCILLEISVEKFVSFKFYFIY